MYSSGIANELELSGLWQAYVIFSVLDIPFKVILGISYLSLVCPPLDWENKGDLYIKKGFLA